MRRSVLVHSAVFSLAFITVLSACGDGKPDSAAQQIAAAQGTCENPIQLEQPGAQAVPSEAIVDGKEGRYQATKVSYYFELKDFMDHHATHQLNSTVTRSGSTPQYSLDLSCKKGDPQAKLNASLLIPDSINRKDGTIVLRTEKFAVDGNNVGAHTFESDENHTLDDFLNRTSTGAAFNPLQTRIYKRSETSFDIVFSAKDFDFSGSNVFGQIHYELK